uniref:Uncharacterized protein n=1 Tax=Glossina austeni TaxID=7395 RepID=A0A1A9V029_GLOAU
MGDVPVSIFVELITTCIVWLSYHFETSQFFVFSGLETFSALLTLTWRLLNANRLHRRPFSMQLDIELCISSTQDYCFFIYLTLSRISFKITPTLRVENQSRPKGIIGENILRTLINSGALQDKIINFPTYSVTTNPCIERFLYTVLLHAEHDENVFIYSCDQRIIIDEGVIVMIFVFDN